MECCGYTFRVLDPGSPHTYQNMAGYSKMPLEINVCMNGWTSLLDAAVFIMCLFSLVC